MTITTSSPVHPAFHGAPILASYDVVVVGARAAGAAAAMLLARSGLSVLAVDRSGYGSDTLSTHSLSLPGVLQLSRWGLLDDIRAAGTPRANRVVFHYGERETTIDVPVRGDVDGLYSPRRTILDARLVDAAVAAGAHVHHGVSLRRVLMIGGRAEGVELDVHGRRQQVRASFVVGADGMRSRVAADVGAQLVHEERSGAANIFAYYSGLPADTIVNHYGPDHVVGVIPTNDGAAVVWAGLSPERFDGIRPSDRPAAHAELVGRVPDLADALSGSERVSRFHAFGGVPGFLRRAHGPGWALVGDAGYFKDPVSAHGITDALIGAELLSRSLVEVIVEGRAEHEALRDYAGTRDRLAGLMMPHVARVARMEDDMGVVEAAFKGMSLAMREEWRLIESGFAELAAAS